jgi:hypothetical protein
VADACRADHGPVTYAFGRWSLDDAMTDAELVSKARGRLRRNGHVSTGYAFVQRVPGYPEDAAAFRSLVSADEAERALTAAAAHSADVAIGQLVVRIRYGECVRIVPRG